MSDRSGTRCSSEGGDGRSTASRRGAIYLVPWLYGLLIDKNTAANFVPVNSADDWLHLLLGVGMIGLGVLGRRAATRARVGDR